MNDEEVRTMLDEFSDKGPQDRGDRPHAQPAYDDDLNTSNAELRSWTEFRAGEYVAVPKVIERLLPGMYTTRVNHDGRIIFEKKTINIDDLLRFPDGISDQIMNEINSFWTRNADFQTYGFLHRRGYLLYGPQGSGKSSIVQLIISDIIQREGIVMLCDNPEVLNNSLSVLRKVEKDRPVVCIFEDIDAVITKWGESEILSLLDGENQIDRVLNIATTNYPEKLDRRIVARPRRFDRIMKIVYPNLAVRQVYFRHKLGSTEGDQWAQDTEGLSFAALAEMVISVKCLGNSFDATVKLLREMSQARSSSREFEDNRMGFGVGNG